jgi:NMD protein affecting ribosome stability and mRNA decay
MPSTLAHPLLGREVMKDTRKGGERRSGLHSPVAKNKGLIRSLARGFARTKKGGPVEAATGHLPEPSVCGTCGAVFTRRRWRKERRITGALLARARWVRCPACRQAAAGVGFGRVVIRGPYALANESQIRRRIANVASRAAHTQPERRVSFIDQHDDMIEVLTTSQKLAHRLVHELRKAFRGCASYAWSDDGTLLARWER